MCLIVQRLAKTAFVLHMCTITTSHHTCTSYNMSNMLQPAFKHLRLTGVGLGQVGGQNVFVPVAHPVMDKTLIK